jgi:xanthine/CO dehydrogenase XdhC/CoxF family maturation factor
MAGNDALRHEDILGTVDAWLKSGTGAMIGSVSGGCIEGAVVQEALAAIKDGKPRLLDFGISNEQAWEVGLACGGKVQVYVERVG